MIKHIANGFKSEMNKLAISMGTIAALDDILFAPPVRKAIFGQSNSQPKEKKQSIKKIK